MALPAPCPLQGSCSPHCSWWPCSACGNVHGAQCHLTQGTTTCSIYRLPPRCPSPNRTCLQPSATPNTCPWAGSTPWELREDSQCYSKNAFFFPITSFFSQKNQANSPGHVGRCWVCPGHRQHCSQLQGSSSSAHTVPLERPQPAQLPWLLQLKPSASGAAEPLLPTPTHSTGTRNAQGGI